MRSALLVLLLCVAACSEEHGTPDDRRDASVRDSSVRDAEPPKDSGEDAQSSDARVADGDACNVTLSYPQTPREKSVTKTWTYDPATRRLVTTIYAYDLDESGRTVNVYGFNPDGGMTRYWTTHYDSHGNIDSYDHYTSGQTAYVNQYDAEGRLETVETNGPGFYSTRVRYRYGEPSTPRIWTLMENDVGMDEADGGPAPGSGERVERTILNGRTDEVRKYPLSGQLHHRYRFAYAGDRIDTIDRDGGYWAGDDADGQADIRFHWVRDAAGNVIEFTQDGTDSFDDPYVDDTPDYKETFSAGCSALLQQFPWIAHEPAPNSTGPRFRTDAD